MTLSEVDASARLLLAFHGLEGWSVTWHSRRRRVAARCCYQLKAIQLSSEVIRINSRAVVRDIVLHEIAHALTPYAGHSEVWRKVAVSIGCSGVVKPSSIRMPPSRWVVVCGACGIVGYLYRRPGRLGLAGRVSYGCRTCRTVRGKGGNLAVVEFEKYIAQRLRLMDDPTIAVTSEPTTRIRAEQSDEVNL